MPVLKKADEKSAKPAKAAGKPKRASKGTSKPKSSAKSQAKPKASGKKQASKAAPSKAKAKKASPKKEKAEKKPLPLVGGLFKGKESDSADKGRSGKPDGFLVEQTSYEFTPSFFCHNGKVASVVQLYVRKGSNRNLTFDNIIDIIPTTPRKGVKIYLWECDGVIRDEEKNQLISANAGDSKLAIANEEKDEYKNAAREDNPLAPRRHEKTESERSMDRADIEDYGDYELLLDDPTPVVYFRFQLVVTGPNMEVVDEQINDLNAVLDQRHPGMRWDSVAGDQEKRVRSLFDMLPKSTDGSVDSSTAPQYAGINFAVSPGLCDEKGVVIGDDVLSLLESAAVFDVEGSTKELAIVAVPSTEKVPLYEKEGRPSVSAASVMLQSAANDVAMHGHRVAHVVLNRFDYFDQDRGYTCPQVPGVFDRFDVLEMTINPMQGFGDYSELTDVYTRLVDKVTNIFDLLGDLQFEKSESGALYKSITHRAIDGFYMKHDLWTSDAVTYPYRTNIVNVQRPEAYPTIALLLQQFTTIEEETRTKGAAEQANDAAVLKSTLTRALDTAFPIFGKTTSITDSDALQVYYDFANVPSSSIRQAQFINILDYVLFTLKRDDVLVIHGADQLYRIVMRKMAAPALLAAMKRGVRVMLGFDTISTPKVQDNEHMNGTDVFDLYGPYYTDFGTDVSWSMMGAMMDDELKKYSAIMNNADLSERIVTYATQRGDCRVLLHRDVGKVNNFVRLLPVI